MRVEDVGREIRGAATQYATAIDAASRTSLRVRVLGLIEKLGLAPDPGLTTRRVSPEELQADAALRGAIVMHLDLVFRSSVTASEVAFTAERGVARVALHPALRDFPVGVVLALPTRDLISQRRDLFDRAGPELGEAEVLMTYALATSPARLGAGARLLEAVKEDARGAGGARRVVAFSPLTGLRAQVIRLVDDEAAWRESLERHAELSGIERELREQLLELLALDTQPDFFPEPARAWLAAEARTFAAGPTYGVGNFHRSMGASLVGVADGGDPKDSDAMWARAFFAYAGGVSSRE